MALGSASRVPLSLLIGIWAALSISSTLGVALAPPLLLHAPLLLVALSPISRHIVLIASMVPLALLLCVVAPRRTLSALLGFYAGRDHGQRAEMWLSARAPRLGRFTRVLERMFQRAGPLLLLLAPGMVFAYFAGVARWSVWLVALLLLVGHAAWAAGTYFLGLAVGQWVAPLVAVLSKYMVEATVLSILAAMAGHLIHSSRMKK